MAATDVTVVENALETFAEDVTETAVDVENPEETTEDVNPSVADKELSTPSEPRQPKPENEVEEIVPVQHNHIYTKTVTKEASCTSIGKIRYECGCGYSYLEDIPQKQHNYLSQVVPATCTKAGYTEYRCKNCTDSYKGNETLATGHFWSEWRVDKKATITSAGIQSRSCSSCDKQETKEIEKIPHGHVYTEKVTTQAKCEETGVKTFSCSCGDSYTQLLPAMGHSWSDWKVTKEESEKESGCKERSCEVCGKGESLEIPKVEHTHSMTHILKKPTCTAGGYTTHKCSICAYTYTDSKVAAKTSFTDVLKDIETLFGLKTEGEEGDKLVLTAYEQEQLKTAYEKSINETSTGEDAQLEYVMYGTYEPLSVTITHILNNKSGISFTSYSHTGLPVAVLADGVNADWFNGYYDNTEIYNKLADMLNVK